MGNSSVTPNTTVSQGCLSSAYRLNREPGWDVGSRPEEDQNGEGMPVGGHDSHPGNRWWCSPTAAAVVPLRMCWGAQKPPELGDSLGVMMDENGGAPV